MWSGLVGKKIRTLLPKKTKQKSDSFNVKYYRYKVYLTFLKATVWNFFSNMFPKLLLWRGAFATSHEVRLKDSVAN